MKVIIVGLPYFSKYLTSKMKSQYPQFTFLALNTYYTKFDKIRFLLNIWNADLVHSINGSLEKSFVFDLSIALRKRLIFHWVGSDIDRAEEVFASKLTKKNYINYPTHLTDTPWFKLKLQKIGIQSQFVPLKGFDQQNELKPLPNTFSILTYIGNSNPEFYGIKNLITIAQALPEIRFDIVGLKEYSDALPSNILLHGWVDNMTEKIENSVICLRMPETDGLAFFVLEALALGRYVAYNQNFEYAAFCSSTHHFIQYILKIKADYDNGILELNEAIAKKITNDFREEIVLKNIMNQYINKY